MLVADKGGDLIGWDIAQHVEARGALRRDAVEDFLGFAGSDGALQSLAGKVDAALRDPLAGYQVLLVLLENLIHDVDGDILEPGDGLGDLLNLVVGEVFHDLAGDFLAEGDHHDSYFLGEREFRFFVVAML